MRESEETMQTEVKQAETVNSESFTQGVQGNPEVVQKKGIFHPRLLMIIGCIIMVASIFLPLASATDDMKEYLEEVGEYFEEYGKNEPEEGFGMTVEDAVHMSVFKFGKLYYYNAKDYGSWGNMYTLWMALDIVFAAMVILTTLRAMTKKPKPISTIILSLLSLGAFIVLCWDLADRGIVDGKEYQWGIALYTYYVSLAMVIVGAVASKVRMVKEKKQKKLIEKQI